MSKRIIAVFGPTHRPKTKRRDEKRVPPEILACARGLGAIIAARGDILLTGGEGPGECSVKDVSIAGAGDGAWVGVVQDGPRDGGPAPKPTNIIVPSALGRKRNFLEALMCDAAIAFVGSEGTRSEVACAFALKRPVALVGAEWRRDHDLDGPDGPQVATDLLQGAQAFLREADPVGDPSFESLIAEHLSPTRAPALLKAARGAPEQQRPYRYFDLPEGTGALGDVVAWAACVPPLDSAPQRQFPVIQGRKDIRDTYIDWLARVEQQE